MNLVDYIQKYAKLELDNKRYEKEDYFTCVAVKRNAVRGFCKVNSIVNTGFYKDESNGIYEMFSPALEALHPKFIDNLVERGIIEVDDDDIRGLYYHAAFINAIANTGIAVGYDTSDDENLELLGMLRREWLQFIVQYDKKEFNELALVEISKCVCRSILSDHNTNELNLRNTYTCIEFAKRISKCKVITYNQAFELLESMEEGFFEKLLQDRIVIEKVTNTGCSFLRNIINNGILSYKFANENPSALIELRKLWLNYIIDNVQSVIKQF